MECAAIRSLSSNLSLTTKPADKGGAVMVWRTDLYIAEARRQLSDTSTYRHLDHYSTPDHQNIISQTIHNLITSDFQFPGPQHLIFTMETQSLYPCIPHVDGLEALHYFLSCRPNQSPSTDTLIHLSELILILNNFSFNSSHFLQSKGVAMGTCTGPSYACLFEGYVEQSLFCSYTGLIARLFFRYIDDCISAASCSHKELEQFINFTNTFHPNFKFTWTISPSWASLSPSL
eukprot:g34402.t1